MASQILWWMNNAVIAVLLAQALRQSFVTKYAMFYFYLSYVLLESLLRYYVYSFEPTSYANFYWTTQFLSVALGYAVIWEIYTQALGAYTGVRQLARTLLLGIFVVVLGKVVANAMTGPVWGAARTTAELERNLRTVQAVLLVAIVILAAYYAIPVGRNLRGLIVGYGFFIGTSVVNLTVRSQVGDVFQLWWQYLQPIAYLVTLVIWMVSLWSYQPNPSPTNAGELKQDYELLSAETAKAIARARRYLVKVVAP